MIRVSLSFRSPDPPSMDARGMADRAIDTHFEGSSDAEPDKGERRRALTHFPKGLGKRKSPK